MGIQKQNDKKQSRLEAEFLKCCEKRKVRKKFLFTYFFKNDIHNVPILMSS